MKIYDTEVFPIKNYDNEITSVGIYSSRLLAEQACEKYIQEMVEDDPENDPLTYNIVEKTLDEYDIIFR